MAARGRHDFAVKVLLGLGAPTTPQNIEAFLTWLQAESSQQRNNPLGIKPGGQFAQYATFEQGVQATVRTLRLGYYRDVVAAMKRGTSAEAVLEAIQRSPWAAGNYGFQLVSGVLPQIRADFTRFAAAPIGTSVAGVSGVGGIGGGQVSSATSRAVGQAIARGEFNFSGPLADVFDKALSDAIKLNLSGQEAFAFAYGKVVQSKEFRTRYAGIFRPDGTLIVTPAAYDQLTASYRSIAGQFSFNIGRQHVASLINREVSPQEFEIRARAVQNVRSNPQILDFLRQALPGQAGTLRDAVNFLLRASDRFVYDAYERALIQASAEAAGLDITQARGTQLARQTEGVLTPEQAENKFKAIATQLRNFGLELGTYGLTQRDLEVIEFGGPDRAKRATKAEQAIRQARAAVSGKRAGPQLGLAQGRPVVMGQPLSAPGF